MCGNQIRTPFINKRMQNRRDFLKTAALAAFGSGLVAHQALAGESLLSTIHINKLGLGGKMKMTFFPYELKLRHVLQLPLIRVQQLPMCRWK